VAQHDEQVTKRRVTMRAPGGFDAEGRPTVVEAVDYVRPDFLEVYVADARTRWAFVEVSDEPDAGPAGYHGRTTIPAHLDHPDAGTSWAPTPGSDAERAELEAAAGPDQHPEG
jgi:hypothetical protein